MDKLFEAVMLICFGMAWPLSIIKSLRSRTVAGKSLFFLCVVFIGYISGIIHKIYFAHNAVLWLYILNAIMVAVDILLFFRNRKLDEAKAQS